MRRTARPTALLAVFALIASLAACASQPKPDAAVAKFLDGWRDGQFPADLPIISADSTPVAGPDVASKIKALAGDLSPVKPTLKSGTATVSKNDASVPIEVSW